MRDGDTLFKTFSNDAHTVVVDDVKYKGRMKDEFQLTPRQTIWDLDLGFIFDENQIFKLTISSTNTESSQCVKVTSFLSQNKTATKQINEVGILATIWWTIKAS